MSVEYNPLTKTHKSIVGAISESQTLTLFIETDENDAVLCVYQDEKPVITYQMEKVEKGFSVKLKLKKGLYFYYFVVDGKVYGNDGEYNLVVNGKPYQLTVYKTGYKTPSYIKGGVMYQIFPDRFNKNGDFCIKEKGKIYHDTWSDTPVFTPDENGEILNNDFFGGNFNGITEKLSYLKSLGVTVIYLNPIFKAYSNHRYDTGDYMSFDPLLGTEEDFCRLVQTAKENGIKIILDGVFNHTGSNSLYFNKNGEYDTVGAYQSKDSKYYSWYNFTSYPDNYESWWGILTLPQVNETNPEYVDFITGENGVLAKYTKLGIGGWRLDVADELPSFFVKNIRKIVKKIDSDAIVIGEVWEDASNKISYGVRREYLQGDELDSVMNYPLKDAIIDFATCGNASRLANVIKEQIDHYPKCVLDSLMNILGTHDTCRILSLLSGKNVCYLSKEQLSKVTLTNSELALAKSRLKLASVIEYTVYGVPCLYYGDEVGVQGYTDPLNRKTFPWGNVDEELCAHYKRLGEIRRLPVFIDGSLEILTQTENLLVFKRYTKTDEIIVVIANGGSYNVKFSDTMVELLSGETTDKITTNGIYYGVFHSTKL